MTYEFKDIQGKCHLCKEVKPILYCEMCQHWFCGVCRTNIPARGIEALKEAIRGRLLNCCGPENDGLAELGEIK